MNSFLLTVPQLNRNWCGGMENSGFVISRTPGRSKSSTFCGRHEHGGVLFSHALQRIADILDRHRIASQI